MLETLGSFDQKIAEKLFSIYPEFEEFSSSINDQGENALVVNLKSPNSNIDDPLTITTENQELSIFFGNYHIHFNELNDDALSLIHKIISDQYCVVSYWRDDQWNGSGLYEVSKLPSTNIDYPHANRILFRSWSGIHNKELLCIPKI